MSRRKKKKRRLNYFRVGMAGFLLVLIIVGINFITSSCSDSNAEGNVPAGVNNQSTTELITTEPTTEPTEPTVPPVVYSSVTPLTATLPDDYDTQYSILIDTETHEILAQKNYNVRMYPASLTKIMTLIVAVENTVNMNDTVLITADMVDPMVQQDASRAGFVAGETPTIEQVLYGMMLPSGGDASLAAASYVAGSEAAFVQLMNEKAQEMGLKNTHFTNVVGLHNDNHYSTAEDIAVILEYALRNETCYKIMTAYQHFIPATEYNPEGILLTSTMFARMTGTEMPGVTVLGGKTGFTDQAGQCLANFATANGKTYIMVLAGGVSRWQTVYANLSAYSVYCVGGLPYDPPQ